MTVVLCFPGQGSQAVGMGKELAEAFPECRAVFAEAAAASKLDLERLCFEGPLDDKHHRGTRSGWRMEGLPWEQL